MLHVVFASLAVCCGIASLICVCLWAKNPDPGSKVYGDSYLGAPSWTNEYFPSYHPVLMVAGFHFAQVLGICMWSFIPNHLIAKTMHVCLMLGAIATMIAGLYAVVSYEQYLYVPSLTSMHSWVGVMTVIIFGMQVVGGFSMGFLSAAGSTLPIMKHIVQIHRATGLLTLFFTSVAILTGIQNYLIGPSAYGNYVSKGTCGYIIASNENFEKTPEKYYDNIPPGCRLGYGVGVLVLLGTMMTGLTVYSRSLAMAGEPEKEVKPQGVAGPNHEMSEMENRKMNQEGGAGPHYEMVENK